MNSPRPVNCWTGRDRHPRGCGLPGGDGPGERSGGETANHDATGKTPVARGGFSGGAAETGKGSGAGAGGASDPGGETPVRVRKVAAPVPG